MGEQNIKNNNDYYLGGILKIKLKTKTVKREFNINNIITLDKISNIVLSDISKLSDNIIQPYNNNVNNNVKYNNYTKYIN